MIRHVVRCGLLSAAIAAALAAPGLGQGGGASDKIVYKKADGVSKAVNGDLKETAPGVYQVLSNGKPLADGKGTLELSPADIVRVVPGADLPGLPRDKLVEMDGMETGPNYAKARPEYEKALKAAGNPKARKYVEARLFLLRARLLEEADEKARATELPQFDQELSAHLLTNATGWEVWPLGRALARVQTDQGKHDAARRTWAQLAKNAGLPKDLRDEAALREVEALIRDGKASESAGRTAELAKATPASESARDRLAIFQSAGKAGGDPAAAIKEIEAVIARTKDPLARATGYATIAELAAAAGKWRDAMWAYLWVEVVFNQDRDEVLNAMARLETIFEKLEEPERAASYKDRLRRYRLAG